MLATTLPITPGPKARDVITSCVEVPVASGFVTFRLILLSAGSR
jgi:hypothetical protein